MQSAKRILLVEDDLDDQLFFTEALHNIHPNIQYEIANDGAEALLLVDSPPPFDMIFLDLNMPKVDGFECLQQLRALENYKKVPVIIVSTSTRVEDIDRCKNLGATTFFSKPSSFEKLFVQLKGILASTL